MMYPLPPPYQTTSYLKAKKLNSTLRWLEREQEFQAHEWVKLTSLATGHGWAGVTDIWAAARTPTHGNVTDHL